MWLSTTVRCFASAATNHTQQSQSTSGSCTVRVFTPRRGDFVMTGGVPSFPAFKSCELTLSCHSTSDSYTLSDVPAVVVSWRSVVHTCSAACEDRVPCPTRQFERSLARCRVATRCRKVSSVMPDARVRSLVARMMALGTNDGTNERREEEACRGKY